MDLIDEGCSAMGGEKFGTCFPVTLEERFVRTLYSSVDEAIAWGLENLRVDNAMVPSCKIGCCHCCSFPILMSIAEARALAQFVKREFSPDQIESLRMRTRQWHEWDDSLRGSASPAPTPMEGQAEEPPEILPCPMLVKSECSAYEVRPLVCRTHFVLSHPLCCHRVSDPESSQARPRVIESIKAATHSYSTAMKDFIEKGGVDYCRSMTLLPHGLAIEMGWDFDKGQ